ncbi:hypothetical protein D3C84_810960 [compost metagenome]
MYRCRCIPTDRLLIVRQLRLVDGNLKRAAWHSFHLQLSQRDDIESGIQYAVILIRVGRYTVIENPRLFSILLEGLGQPVAIRIDFYQILIDLASESIHDSRAVIVSGGAVAQCGC